MILEWFAIDCKMFLLLICFCFFSTQRRPNTLVEILPRKFASWDECKKARKSAKEKEKKAKKGKNKQESKGLNLVDSVHNSDGLGREFGIITYPKGYYWWFHYKAMENFTDEEKATAYQPYSGNVKTVRVMKVNPLRTFANPVMWWMVCFYFFVFFLFCFVCFFDDPCAKQTTLKALFLACLVLFFAVFRSYLFFYIFL